MGGICVGQVVIVTLFVVGQTRGRHARIRMYVSETRDSDIGADGIGVSASHGAQEEI